MSPLVLFLHDRQCESGSEFKGIRGQQGVKPERRRAAAVQGVLGKSEASLDGQ